METWLSWLQFAAFASGVLGQWLIARKDVRAFALWTASNVLLIAFSITTQAWWLLAMYLVYLGGSLHAWHAWARTGASGTSQRVVADHPKGGVQ